MATRTQAGITEIEDAATARWLTKALATARDEAQDGPTEEAVDRIRARVLGDTAVRKVARRIAA